MAIRRATPLVLLLPSRGYRRSSYISFWRKNRRSWIRLARMARRGWRCSSRRRCGTCHPSKPRSDRSTASSLLLGGRHMSLLALSSSQGQRQRPEIVQERRPADTDERRLWHRTRRPDGNSGRWCTQTMSRTTSSRSTRRRSTSMRRDPNEHGGLPRISWKTRRLARNLEPR